MRWGIRHRQLQAQVEESALDEVALATQPQALASWLDLQRVLLNVRSAEAVFAVAAD